MEIPSSQATKLPQKPGVYQFIDAKGILLYIGKAKNLRDRVKTYFIKGLELGPKTAAMLSYAKQIRTIVVESEIEALLLEAALIKKFKPKYNTVAKDDKSHLYIKISSFEDVSLVTTARREKERRGIKLFGPFPQASTVRSVLRILRHIFPYCTEKHPKRRCLYCHLGLCPFPWESEENKTEYRKTVKKITLFLQGKKKRLINDLKKEMAEAAKKLEFEKAASIKKQIEDLEYITTPARAPEEYLARPDLVEDIAAERLSQLANVLNLKSVPERIECYDISNIAGYAATGSLVVFENGLPAKNWYRKFKIRIKETPDDVAMMTEVLERRFKNDWPQPDLIVVDGGKGQLNAVKRVLGKFKIKIPYLALAKRKEEIFIAGKFNPLKLDKNSAALQLVQALRDEAHRFAILYHRKLRSRLILT